MTHAITSILIFALIALSSILILAFAIRRSAASIRPQLRSAARFVGGPFSISIAIHLAFIFTLIIYVHESRARDLLIVTMQPGTDRAIDDADQLAMPDDIVTPDFNTHSTDDSPQAIDVNKVMRNSSEIAGTPAETGMDLGRHLGAFNLHPGPGGGIGTFPGFVLELRRKGLDIVLVIDGTKSMDFVMDDVKARMTQLAVRIRNLVPIARVGVVVFGGKGEQFDIQPLTLSTAKLQTFLGSIQAKGGGEWEENTYGAVQTAITRMDWKPYARKVIILIGDSPPEKADFAPLVALIRNFRRNNNGTLSTVDVVEEEHERYEREFAIKVHRDPTIEVSPLPEFARQAQAAYKVLAVEGGGSIRSLSDNAKLDQQVMILVFGDRWQEDLRHYASR
jgi:von Willebrand factor type A domain